MDDYVVNLNGYQLLIGAIVKQTVSDYQNALRGKGYGGMTCHEVVRSCESFFRSDWFAQLVDVDGEVVIQSVKSRRKDHRKLCL